MIEQTINYLFSIEIKVIPVILLYIICLLPTEFRKQMRFKYTPIYCSLPMLQQSRRLQDFHLSGFENTAEERRRIRKENRISFIFEALFIPISLGFIFGLCKAPKDVIYPLLVLLVIKRGWQCIKCILDIKKECSLPRNIDLFLLFCLYVAYIWLYIRNMNKGYILGLQDVSLILTTIINVAGTVIEAIVLSMLGASIDFTSINYNYPQSDLEVEVAMGEEVEE